MKMSPGISSDFYYLMNSAVLLIPELERIFLDLRPLETAWKIGFKAVALNQNFSRIYNGYRDLTTYKYLVGDTDVNGVHIPLPWVAVCLGRQSVNDYQNTGDGDYDIYIYIYHEKYLN